jgi:hypothetical protein
LQAELNVDHGNVKTDASKAKSEGFALPTNNLKKGNSLAL